MTLKHSTPLCLSLKSNRIIKLEGLENLRNLQEFYISHNGIQKIEGLDNNLNLTTLDVAGNRIDKIENVSQLKQLEEFWCNDNQIDGWGCLEELRNISTLETIYLERNPIQSQDNGAYRRKVMLTLPQIKQLDATLTGN
eukprot:gene15346-16923_t